MRFLQNTPPNYDLTYNDVFLLPGYTDLSSRFAVDLTTPDHIGTTIPIVVSNMNAVAGKRMAETMARRGGLTVLPQDLSLPALESTVKYIKSRHPIYETPLTLSPENTIHDALNIIEKRAHGAVIIVNQMNEPVGIFKEKDAGSFDRFTPLGLVMSRELVTIPAGWTPKRMFELLHSKRVTTAPVIKNKKMVGLMTQKGALRSSLYTPALGHKKRLLTAAAIGINGDVAAKVEQVLALGVDVLVLDTAHGHQHKMVDAIKNARHVSKTVPIVAGNIVTQEGTRALLEAGANIVKVGVGPGAMCTTRMMTGVGRPQFSAVAECAAAARAMGCHVWADGGIRYPRDVALALAAGASNVMFASWLAGTYESVADVMRDSEGRLYKESYGMASRRAVKNRSSANAPYDQALKALFEEGISNSKLFLDPEKSGVEDIIDEIVAGVRSSMTYVGAQTIGDFYDKAVVGIQSPSGYQEGRSQDTTWD